ncbi:MAG: UDP-N-acetylmuramoyl-L-alanine--D-glutamate ligase [Sphingomicrobium sp.]
MIISTAFAGKHYAVLGLARSGLATVEALLASGARVTAWDDDEGARIKLESSLSRSDGEVAARSADGGAMAPTLSAPPPPASPAVPLPTSFARREDLRILPLDDVDLTQFDSLVLSPGVPLNRSPLATRARDAGLEIIGDIELFARARPELPPHKVVGITGTNGKSTTTALVHHILQTAGVPSLMGGNIGLPILAQDPLPEGGVYVLELSSYQLDLTQSLACDVAVLLNITPDHLDRYESFEAYAASKARLFEMQSTDNFALVNWDEFTRGAVNPVSGFNGIVLPASADQSKWPTLQGPHNAQNAAAAIGVCSWLGLDEGAIDQGLRTYPGLQHRMERVSERDSVLFINDSKATNATATAPALAAFPAIRWILGGQAKSGNLDECAPHFSHVRSAYTIGEASGLFARLLGPHMPVAECGTLDAAVRAAAHDAKAGDTVLLSPACASFDQFKDFEARGDAFREYVRAL